MKNRKILLYIGMTLLAVSLTACGSRKADQQEYREKGIALMENGQYEEALETFAEALDLSLGTIGETEKDICFYKAEALYRMGDTEGAMQTYTAIINYDQSPKAYFLRGNLYYSLGDENAACKDYAAAVEQEKEDYELYIGVYEALAAHGRQEDAEAYLHQGLQINGNRAYDKMQKGRMNFLLGKQQTAISLLKEAANAKEPMAYYYLAEIYEQSGEMDSAEENLRLYLQSGQNDAYALQKIAAARLDKGDFDTAIECLNTALNLEKVPNRQSLMKLLVVAYEKNHDFEAAKKWMAEYVKDYPEDEAAMREYTFLETR